MWCNLSEASVVNHGCFWSELAPHYSPGVFLPYFKGKHD